MLLRRRSKQLSPKLEWSNWSTNQRASPQAILSPKSIEELQDSIKSTPYPIRVCGSGHSFAPIVPSKGSIISLQELNSGIHINPHTKQASVPGGASLRDLSVAFDSERLAFENLGDINTQSIAGATSTATHGTGLKLPCLSANLSALTLLTASGEILEISEIHHPELLDAAKVSLGALGIVVSATIKLRDTFNLHRQSQFEPIDVIFDQALERWRTHRNYEFFYIPFSDHGLSITHNETVHPPTKLPQSADDLSLWFLQQVRNLSKSAPAIRGALIRSVLKFIPKENNIASSWRILSSERGYRFNEMEYHLPIPLGLDVCRDVIRKIERVRPDVFFPIEVRATAGDSAWLSPFQGGPRISIAVHTYYKEAYDWLHTEIEPMLIEAGGRPHWGKLHSLGAKQLEGMYPDFGRFCEVRQKLDPNRVFVTEPLAKIWGL